MKKAILLVLAASIVHAAIALSVDASNEFRDVTHVGIGTLYGVTKDLPADIEGLVKPLNPYMFTMPARAGNGNQHNNGAGAIEVAERLARAGISSATVTISLADLCPWWPYKFPGWDSWKTQVESVIADKRKSSGKYYGYDIWNEPEGTWQGLDPTKQDLDLGKVPWADRRASFYELWKKTYDLIREKDPGEKIIGPCEAWYAADRIEHFLTYCKTNNCLPDIMCWHSLGGTAGITGDVSNYRAMETRLGISPRPISLNEYGESYLEADKPYEGCPGRSAAQIAKMERIGIESASISWWHTQYAGQLSSLLASNTAKGAGWFFYKWYGEMSGKMIMVTPPATNNRNVDGFANIDHDKKFISILFGGANDNSKTVNVNFSKLPSWIGSAAKVKIEKVDWTSRTTVSNGPTTISETNYNVTNNSLSVSVTGCNDSSGYRIYLTPANTPSSSSLATSSSSRAASSSSITGPLECNEYKATYCGGLAYGAVPSNSTTVPTTGECLFIGDFEQIQPSLNSTVVINGLEITLVSAEGDDQWKGADSTIVKEGNKKPAKKDGGYYVYVKAGGINTYQDNGWKNIVAKEKPACGSTPVAARSLLATSHSPTYYSIKGEPLGNAKPQKAGVYIVKQGNSVKKIAVR